MEQLESRELLVATPWAGSDVVIADFDGDGNLDRLGSLAASTAGAETWSIDTKASSAAGTVENWKVTRVGAVPASGLPALNQFLVGDFNGDGRDDILARTGSSTWYMIQSRVSPNPSIYQGEFTIYLWGTVSTSGNWSMPVVGDFNGDGRDDLAAFDESNPANKQWQVMTSTGTGFNAQVTWAGQQTLTPIAGSIVSGDFNGDGRDDLLFKKSSTNWAIAVSDGSRFNVVDPASPITATWTSQRVGDFDGDGGDELLGWNSSAGRWETIKYDDHRGMSLDVSWGNALGGAATNQNIHVGDANRDGRDDLIAYNTTTNKWQVALSQQLSTGANSFVTLTAASNGTNDWDRWFKDWDWGPSTAAYKFLNVDAPYQHFLDVFSDVYNTVELELYPGLMKGIEATDQTKAGNDWDQAALLVERLEPNVASQTEGQRARIATGKVLVDPVAAKEWIGTTTAGAAFSVIDASLDGGADLSNGKYRFKHAWVQALVPTADGLKWVDVDPSWKFKDRQPGEAVDLTNINTGYTPIAGRQNRGTFDEFGYLGNAGTNQLPVEWYEDQVMKYLADANKNKSLADVPYDGPIIQKKFETIPIGWGDLVVESPAMVETFENFAFIANSPSLSARLTHRATVSVARGGTSAVGLDMDYSLPPDFPTGEGRIVFATAGSGPNDIWNWNTDWQGGNYVVESGPRYVLNGTKFVAVPIPNSTYTSGGNYTVTSNTRMRFELHGTANVTGVRLAVGVDVDNNFDNYVNELVYPLDSEYTIGSGNRQLDIPIGQLYSGTANLSRVVLGLYKNGVAVTENQARAEFRNIVLYENDNTSVVDGTIIKQRDSATAAINLPEPHTITPSTRLEFEFRSDSVGPLHAIAWDNDYDGTNDSTGPSKRYILYGASSPPGYVEATPTYNGNGWMQFSLPIGSHLTGTQTDTLERLLFITRSYTNNGNVESEFRNITIRDVSVPTDIHLEHTFVVPAHSLDSINVDYVKHANLPSTTADDTYDAQLVFKSSSNATTSIAAAPGKTFHFGDEMEIQIEHQGPTDFGIANPSANTYSRKAGQILAIGLDANQYSTEFIVGLQAGLNSSLADGASVSDIGELLSYTSAKYWHELNRNSRTIDGLLRTVGGEQWVGSGIVTSDPYLLTASIPGFNNGNPLYSPQDLAHLQFPILPYNMGVDLPNTNHVSIDVSTGLLNDEAFRLFGFNASSLENAILEEVVNSASISTIRGLQNAYKSSSVSVWVYESVWDAGQRKIYQRGSIGSTSGATTYNPSGGSIQTSAQVQNTLTSGSSPHSLTLAQSIVAILENQNNAYGGADLQQPIRVLIPKVKSILGSWSGSVYLAEYQTPTGKAGAYIIAPDGGTPSSGGYSGNSRKVENKSLPPATYINQTYAGDPVNVANGNMFRDEVDFTFANPIIPLDFARHYDSQNKLDVGFGVGWVHNFTGFIYQEQDPANPTDMDFVWLRGNGERHTFENENYTLPNTLFGDVLTSGSGTSRRLTAFKDRSGTQYIFEAIASPFVDSTTQKTVYSRLISIKDATGYQGVNITYDDTPTVKSVRVSKVASISVPGRALEFAYATNAVNIKRVEGNPLQPVSTWAYVLATNTAYTGKRLTQVKHANQSTSVTNYTYYQDGPAARKGLIKTITEPNLESHTYEYYANGRVFRVTDGAGNQQSFNYNLFRNLTEFTDENGNVETYIHQDNGLLTKQIHDDRSRQEFTWGPQTGSGSVQWEEFLMQSSTDELGNREVFDYYGFSPSNSSQRPGELFTSTSKDGIISTFTYISHPYISSVATITETPQGGTSLQTAQYTYDTNGNVLTATDAAGNVTEYEYYDEPASAHLRGLRKSETLSKGVSGTEAVVWEVLADEFEVTGNTLTMRLLTGDDPNKQVVADAIRIDRVDGDGVFTKIVDDDISGSNPNFRTVSAGGIWQAGSTRPKYGGDALAMGGSDTAEGSATWIFSDLQPGAYRISASWVYSVTREDDAVYQIFQGLPDGTPDRTVAGVNQTVAPNDFRSYQTVFEYDTAGNLIRAITEGLPTGYRAYDSFGNVLYEEDATGVATAFTYDVLGRLVKSAVVDPKVIKFDTILPYNYAGVADNANGTWQAQSNDDTLYIYGSNRLAVPLNHNITPSTILEFDMNVTSAGDWYAVSVVNQLNQPRAIAFKLGGADQSDYGFSTDFNSYQAGSGPKHFRIPLGQLYGTTQISGTYGYLVFNNVDTNSPNGPIGAGQTYFSNVRVYESTTASSVATTTYTYDASGRLKSSKDALGRTTTYSYDANGRLNKTSFADGTFTTHDYDAIGNCISITDELGRTTRFVYDSRNRLIQTIYADGSSTRTAYDGVGQVVESTNELGHAASFKYDKVGRLLETKRLQQFAGEANVSITTKNAYDSRGRLFTSEDANGVKTRYTYDNLDRVVETRVLNKAETNPTSPTLPPAFLSTTEYDANGNIARTTVYDVPRLLLSTSEGGGGLSSIPTTHSGALALIGSHSDFVQLVYTKYDAYGRPVEVTNADGTATSTIYDAASRVRFTFDELGRKTEFLYDQFGRLEQTILPDPNGPTGSGQSPKTRYERDAAGKITEQWEFFGTYNGTPNVEYADIFAYDARNRLVSTIRKDGFQERNVYDVASQMVATIDALGNATYTQYDERGRVVTERLADPDGSGTQFAPVTKYEYDPAGNVVATTDPLGNTTWFEYDSLNRLRKESHNHTLIVDDAEGGDSSFSIGATNSSGVVYVPDAQNVYGRDATILPPSAGNPRLATWTFKDLEAGLYRISLSSATVVASPSATIVEILNGAMIPLVSYSLDQLKPSPDFQTAHGEQALGWDSLPELVNVVSNGSTMSVRIGIFSPTGNILADAVRIDRLVSTAFTYDKNGNQLSETDTRGYTSTYQYDELGRPTLVKTPDPDGTGTGNLPLETRSSYDGYGNVIKTTENRGTTTTTDDRINLFQYDRRNRLVEEVINYSTATGDDKNVTMSYVYDAVGNTIEITDAEGYRTAYRYDNLDRVIDKYQDFGEGDDAVQAIGLSSSNVGTYGFDGSTIASNVSFPNAYSIQLTGNAWKKISINYTLKHNTVLEFEFQSEKEAEFQLIGFDTNDSFGGLDYPRFFELSGSNSAPGVFQTEFRREVLPDNSVRFHIPVGQYLTDVEKASGLVVTRLVLVNWETRAELDPADRGKSTFSNIRLYESDEVRTVYTYDTRGNVETVREASDPRKITTRYFYDRLGRRNRTDVDDDGAQQIVYSTQYDNVGNVIADSNLTAGTTTVHEYDRLHRRIKTTLPDPDSNVATPNGLVTTFGYDVAGNLIRETNGEGESTHFAYNELGLVVSETDGNGDETRYRYDSEGNLLSVTDAEQNTTTYTYDGLNRIRTETNAFGTRSYTYNAAGNLERLFNRNGSHIQFTYDTLDRKLSEWWRAGGTGTSIVHVLSWEYDKLGRIVKQVDGNTLAWLNGAPNTIDDIIDTFRYDGLGRLVEQANYDLDNPTFVSTAGLPRVRQTYEYFFQTTSTGQTFNDRVGRSQFLVTATGEVPIAYTQYEYDRLGRLNRTEELDSATSLGPSIERKYLQFGYDTSGNLNYVERRGNFNAGTNTWQNTFASHLTYDKSNRVTAITHDLDPNGSAGDVVHAYAYDNASRVTSFDTAVGAAFEGRDYEYDNAGQLTLVEGGGVVAGGGDFQYVNYYEYDENGNRIATEAAPTIVTGPANRLTSDGTYTYTYDNEGNVLTRTRISSAAVNDKLTEYTWDHRNRLTKVTFKDNSNVITQSVTYTYDAEGRRVKRVHDVDGATGSQPLQNEYYVYDGDDLSMTYSSTGTAAPVLEHRYLHGPADLVLVDEVFNAAGQSTDTLWQLGDQQGTPRDIVDDNGVLRKHIDYDSFGKILGEQFYAKNGTAIASTHAEAIEQLFYFTGQERDEVTGLQHHGSNPGRWYDPTIGRWLSEDTIADPNLYAYTDNDPINNYDPTGKSQAGNPLNNLPGLSNPYSKPTVKSIDQYYFDQGLKNPLSAGTYNFAAPTREQISNAQLNPHGSVTKIETINSTIHGDKFRRPAAALDQIARNSTNPLAAGTAQFFKPVVSLAGNIAGGLIDTVFPPSDPSRIATYADGTRNLYLGEGPSSRSYADLLALGTTGGLRSAARPATQIVSSSAPRSGTINPVVQRTNAQLVSDVAVRAERKIGGTGAVAGIAKHGYADDLLTRYQRIYGDRGLRTEVRYLNGQVWEPGMGLRGTVRLDVVEGAREAPTAVFDYKFGGATLSPARVNQIQSGARLNPSVPIYQVKP